MPGNDPSDVPNLRPDGVWAAIQYCRGDATNPGRRVKLSLRLRPTPVGWWATFVPSNVRVIHPDSDCQSQLGPYSAWGRRRTHLCRARPKAPRQSPNRSRCLSDPHPEPRIDGHRPGVRHRVDNRLRVRRLLRDFIEKTDGTERPCTDDGQCPRTDNHRPRTNDT
jgi:hypothetical protein